MNTWIRGAVVAVCTLGLSAMAQGTTAKPSTQNLPKIPTEPKAYLERIQYGNQMEVQLSELARTKAVNPQVKEFASLMVTDHQNAMNKVTQVAERQKMKLGEPKPMNDMEKKSMAATKATMEMLQSLDGMAFDQVYMANIVQNHDKMLGKLAAGQQQFGTAEWASIIGELMPKVSQHRDEAYRILGTLKTPTSGMGTGGAGMEHSGQQKKY